MINRNRNTIAIPDEKYTYVMCKHLGVANCDEDNKAFDNPDGDKAFCNPDRSDTKFANPGGNNKAFANPDRSDKWMTNQAKGTLPRRWG